MAILVQVRSFSVMLYFTLHLFTESGGDVDEILLSSDKTIAIIDGSGVLADPAGLNREELVRLAHARIPVANFDLSKLSKDGYLVRVEDQDVKLPSHTLHRAGNLSDGALICRIHGNL